MVKDTYKGTETDMEGRWRLDNLAAGDYTFAVSFISYKSIEVSCRVAADVEGVDVRLESDSEEVEEVVVKARMRSDTEIAMLGTIKAVPLFKVMYTSSLYSPTALSVLGVIVTSLPVTPISKIVSSEQNALIENSSALLLVAITVLGSASSLYSTLPNATEPGVTL